MADLEKEFEYYRANKADFLAKYEGKFIVIKGHEVLGTFDEQLEAINETRKNHELGTFLVHQVTKDDDVAFFYSRVGFKNDRSA